MGKLSRIQQMLNIKSMVQDVDDPVGDGNLRAEGK
jgi:hypothetical protein